KIFLRRALEWAQPDGVDAQRLFGIIVEIIQPLNNAVDIAHPIGVRIHKAARVYLVHNTCLPPVQSGVLADSVRFLGHVVPFPSGVVRSLSVLYSTSRRANYFYYFHV